MQRILITILIIILVIGAVWGIIFVSKISCITDFEGVKKVVIEPGQNLEQVGEQLLEQGIISSKFYFKVYLYLNNKQKEIKAGEYNLSALNIIDLSKKLVKGEPQQELTVKFIEGWTLDEMADYLVKQNIINNKNDFLQAAQTNNFKKEYEFLNNLSNDLQNVRSQSLEGFIFPDTYRVFENASAEDIIGKALDNFDDKMTAALKTEITAQGKNLYDVLIMASIIEQEVPQEEDRKVVSGILWKRIENDMLLQTDSTLKYIIGKQDRNVLTYEELESDSPYNTYKFKGLPPTPICNPGESAIRAAIYPKNSDYWFYLSTNEGQTIFSKTGTEHEQNVDRYLR